MPKLSSITFNELTVKDSFAFAEEILHHDGKLFIGSLDFDSLFTNITLKKTINICINLLFNNVDVIEGINKSNFDNFFYSWLPRNRILCLTIFFINKRTV